MECAHHLRPPRRRTCGGERCRWAARPPLRLNIEKAVSIHFVRTVQHNHGLHTPHFPGAMIADIRKTRKKQLVRKRYETQKYLLEQRSSKDRGSRRVDENQICVQRRSFAKIRSCAQRRRGKISCTCHLTKMQIRLSQGQLLRLLLNLLIQNCYKDGKTVKS